MTRTRRTVSTSISARAPRSTRSTATTHKASAPHDLRRTNGSWQARAGASLLVIGKSLNHKTPEATAIYARLDLDPVRQSVESATAAMFEAAGVKVAAKIIPLGQAKAAKKRSGGNTNAA